MVEVIEVVRRRMLSSTEAEHPQRGRVRFVARGPSEGEQTKDRCGENVPSEPLTRISLAVRGWRRPHRSALREAA